MSRRRRRSQREGGVSPPSRFTYSANPVFRPYTFKAWRSYTPPVLPYRPPLASRPYGLVHPARPSRTVRPLIRTVLTDTLSPRRGTRTHLDLMRRAVLRSRSPSPWTPGPLRDFGPDVYVEKVPLQRTTTCARRTIRKEVLFALGRTGSGSGSKTRRRTPESKVRC